MFVLAARFAGYGLRLLRLGAQNKSLSIVGKICSPSKLILKPLGQVGSSLTRQVSRFSKSIARGMRRVIGESSENYALRVQKDFSNAAKELGIPKELQPKLILEKLPINLGGAYVPASTEVAGTVIPGHRLYINSGYSFFSRLFPGVSKKFVRHELKHSQQYLDIAKGGMNSRLGKHALPEGIANAAERLGSTLNTNMQVERRLEQAINCIRVNKRNFARQRNFSDFLYRSFNQATGFSSRKFSGRSVLKELESTLCDSKKVKAFEQELCARLGSMKKTHRAYHNDLFEREARNFGSFFGLSKLLNSLTQKSVYLV